MIVKPKRQLQQFFTPYEVAKTMVALSQRRSGIAIDPSCGDGVFLQALLDAGFRHVVGVDIDPEAIAACARRFGNRVTLRCQNALNGLDELGRCALVVGNPPFSNQKDLVDDEAILEGFQLGTRSPLQGALFKDAGLKVPQEVLFLERFIQLAAPEGDILIILPDNIAINSNLQRVRDFIISRTFVKTVVSLPRRIFQGTTAKTIILHLVKKPASLPRQSPRDRTALVRVSNMEELVEVPSLVRSATANGKVVWKSVEEVRTNMLPDYHLSQAATLLAELRQRQLTIKPIGDAAQVWTGYAAYGGDRAFALPEDTEVFRFITAKVVQSYGLDFARDEKYIRRGSKMFQEKAIVQDGDVLIVRVGVGCIGRTTVVYQNGMCVADDWIHIIRTKSLNPFYLAAYLGCPIGQGFVAQLKHGVGTESFSQSALKRVPIVIPNTEIQHQVEQAYKPILRDCARGAKREELLPRVQLLHSYLVDMFMS